MSLWAAWGPREIQDRPGSDGIAQQGTCGRHQRSCRSSQVSESGSVAFLNRVSQVRFLPRALPKTAGQRRFAELRWVRFRGSICSGAALGPHQDSWGPFRTAGAVLLRAGPTVPGCRPAKASFTFAAISCENPPGSTTHSPSPSRHRTPHVLPRSRLLQLTGGHRDPGARPGCGCGNEMGGAIRHLTQPHVAGRTRRGDHARNDAGRRNEPRARRACRSGLPRDRGLRGVRDLPTRPFGWQISPRPARCIAEPEWISSSLLTSSDATRSSGKGRAFGSGLSFADGPIRASRVACGIERPRDASFHVVVTDTRAGETKEAARWA